MISSPHVVVLAVEHQVALVSRTTQVPLCIAGMQLQCGVQLHERESLIVFDEVQLCPKARQAIKRLVADGRYDYIETGSLISIRRNTEGILIPSEERKLQMHPMDYEEFCWAKGD